MFICCVFYKNKLAKLIKVTKYNYRKVMVV